MLGEVKKLVDSEEEERNFKEACRELYELQAQIHQLSKEFKEKIPKAVESERYKYAGTDKLVEIGVDDHLMERLLKIIQRIRELLKKYGSILKRYGMDSISVDLWLITFNFRLPED